MSCCIISEQHTRAVGASLAPAHLSHPVSTQHLSHPRSPQPRSAPESGVVCDPEVRIIQGEPTAKTDFPQLHRNEHGCLLRLQARAVEIIQKVFRQDTQLQITQKPLAWQERAAFLHVPGKEVFKDQAFPWRQGLSYQTDTEYQSGRLRGDA